MIHPPFFPPFYLNSLYLSFVICLFNNIFFQAKINSPVPLSFPSATIYIDNREKVLNVCNCRLSIGVFNVMSLMNTILPLEMEAIARFGWI